MNLPLAFVLYPQETRKTSPKTIEYRLLQFAVQLEYRVRELSQKLRQSWSERPVGQWSSPAKWVITEVSRVTPAHPLAGFSRQSAAYEKPIRLYKIL